MQDGARPVPPELLQLLGSVVTQWSAAEALLQEFLSFLLKSDPGMTYVMTQKVSGSTIVDWIRTAVDIRFSHEGTVARLKNLLVRIDETRAERNALVHGVWTTRGCEPGVALVQTVRWERREVVKHELITAADLHQLLNDIRDIVDELAFIDSRLHFVHRADLHNL